MKKLLFFLNLTAIAAFVVLFFSTGTHADCTKDVDCKGNRVCEKGICVDPGQKESNQLHNQTNNLERQSKTEEKSKEPDFEGRWRFCSKDYGWPCPGLATFFTMHKENGEWKVVKEAGEMFRGKYIVAGRHIELPLERNSIGWLWGLSLDLNEDNKTMEGTWHQIRDMPGERFSDTTYHVIMTKEQ